MVSQARHASADWAPSDAYLVTVRDKARSPVLRECVNKPNNASLILSLPLPLLLSNIYTLKKKTKKQGGTDYLSTYTFLTFVSLWGGGALPAVGVAELKEGVLEHGSVSPTRSSSYQAPTALSGSHRQQ